MCNPAAFVVATVAGDTPEVRVPEDCRGPGAHCLIAWPMKIKIDEILATRPSDPALTDDTALRVGSIFMVNVDVFPSAAATEIAADNYQGRLSAPTLAGAELTRSIRGHRFIFGLGTNYAGRSPPRIVSENASQIWSMSFQGVLETILLHAARRATAEAPDRCAVLDEQKALEVAVADHPDQSAPLLLLANLHERISRYGLKEEKDRELTKANELYRRAIVSDSSGAALEGFIRSLGSNRTNWSVTGLSVAQEILARDPGNAMAKRLLVQSLIHVGHINLIDKADLSHGTFDLLNLSGRRLGGATLNASRIAQLDAYNADLSNADLRDLKVGQSRLWHTDLRNAQLQGAELGQMALADADLGGVTGLRSVSSTDASGASFEAADLDGAAIGIQQNGIGFPLAPFYGDYLDVEDDQPRRTAPAPAIRFARAHLRRATIRIGGMQLDFAGADLRGAQFDLSDLRGADFTSAQLDGTTFQQSVYDCRTKWPDGFVPGAAALIPLPGPPTCEKPLRLVYDGMLLDGMNFSGLDLRGSSFHRVKRGFGAQKTRFVGADLSGADLRDADFRGALLGGARLTGARYSSGTQWPPGFDPNEAGARFSPGPGD